MHAHYNAYRKTLNNTGASRHRDASELTRVTVALLHAETADERAEAIEEIARVMRASKDAAPAPVRVLEETSDVPATDWEEIRLLPPPSEAKDSKAA